MAMERKNEQGLFRFQRPLELCSLLVAPQRKQPRSHFSIGRGAFACTSSVILEADFAFFLLFFLFISFRTFYNLWPFP